MALLFLTGVAGFRQAVALGALMAGSYLVAVLLLFRDGYDLVVGYEVALAVLLFVLGCIAGVVLQRAYDLHQQALRLRKKLETLALTDSLTGLPNRRQLEERLAQEIDLRQRYGGTRLLC